MGAASETSGAPLNIVERPSGKEMVLSILGNTP